MIPYNDFLLFTQSSDNGFLLLFCSGILFFLLLSSFRLCFPAFQWPQLNPPRLEVHWILLLALLLRLPQQFQSFWYDESFTAALSSLPLDRSMMVILSDVHPPLAYLPYWLTAQVVGTIPYLLRLPSFIAGLLSVWALRRLGNQWGENCGKIAGLLGALMPSLIWYSAEARAYAFLVLGLLLALIALEEKRPILFGLAIGLLPLLHVFGYLYAAFLGCFALWRKSIPLKVLIAAALPALLWLPFMAYQSSDVANGFWLPMPTAGAAVRPLIELSIGFAYPPFVAFLAIPLMVLLSLLAIVHNFKREMMPYLLLFAGIPTAAFLLSWLWHPIYLPRAMLPSFALLILFFARWINEARPVAAAALYLLFALVLPYQLIDKDAAKQDLGSFVAACEGENIFAISLEAAIVADSYSTKSIHIASDWNNLNQALSPLAIQALGYEVKNWPASGDCLYWQDTPPVTQAQRNLKIFLISTFDLICHRLLDTPYRVIEVCRER